MSLGDLLDTTRYQVVAEYLDEPFATQGQIGRSPESDGPAPQQCQEAFPMLGTQEMMSLGISFVVVD